MQDGWHQATRNGDHYADSLLSTQPRTTERPRMTEVLPIKRTFGPSTVEVFLRWRTCRIPCDRPPRDLCVPPSVVSSSLSSPHSSCVGKFPRELLSWGSTLPSLGRPGPVFAAPFHLVLEKEPEWFLQRVRAAAAQFRRVLQPQRVGYNRQCFCGRCLFFFFSLFFLFFA